MPSSIATLFFTSGNRIGQWLGRLEKPSGMA
jgi:hypothetical protein